MNQPIIENQGKVLSVSFDFPLNHASFDSRDPSSNDTNHSNARSDDNNLAQPHKSCSYSSSSLPRRRKFHAAWLWHNDSRNIMIPSGQKKHSASSWWNNGKPIIVKASVHPVVVVGSLCCLDYKEDDHQDTSALLNHENVSCFVIPKGSIHPMRMGMMMNMVDHNCKITTTAASTAIANGNSNSTGRSSSSDQHDEEELPASTTRHLLLSDYVLAITWDYRPNQTIRQSPTQQEEGSSSKQDCDVNTSSCSCPLPSSSTESGCTSIFNMQWLMDWSLDNTSEDATSENLYHDARVQREVSTKHTFIHAYKQLQALAAKGNGNDELRRRRSCHDGLISVDYHDLVQDSTCGVEYILPFLDALFLEGAVVVKNAPHTKHDSPEDVITHIGKVISGGALSHGSLYGDTFHVKSTRDAINVAYTSHELCPHQDLAYYESKPGFQLLFCASMPPNIIGGESILIDCMAAAHAFREIAPDLFETLVKCSACFVKDRKGARMTYSRPHIVLHADGSSEWKNDIHREIVSVHWSPPFEGPMPTLRPELMEEYLKAYGAFELMLDNTKCPLTYSEATGIDLELTMKLAAYGKEYTWQKLLKPGEVLVFNNTRMLHGRRKFEMPSYLEKDINEDGVAAHNQESVMERHLVGGYTNIDDSLNRYRTLLKEANIHRTIPNVGNGTVSVLP